jgi:hypothetical protein
MGRTIFIRIISNETDLHNSIRCIRKHNRHADATDYDRGEAIYPGGVFVKFNGSLWLEVANSGGGSLTTDWLQTNYPAMGWIGSEGKPNGFYDAPAVAQAASFRELISAYRSIFD